MQTYQCKICTGDALSLKILSGETSAHLQTMLLTQGVEIELLSIDLNFITLNIRAPSELMIIKELADGLCTGAITA